MAAEGAAGRVACGAPGVTEACQPRYCADGETPHLLDALLRVPAPSGYEAPATEVWREAASFAEVRTDGLGSSMALVGPDGGEPVVAIAGHLDEIGLVVTHIDDKGFIWFQPIGGWDPQILVGQRVEVTTKDGPVFGVAGRKPIHLLEEEQRKKVVELKELHIDIGAEDADAAKRAGADRRPRRGGGRAGAGAGRAPDLALDGQPPRLLCRARGRPPLRREREDHRPGRRRGERPGGDRPLWRADGRVRAASDPRGRG